MRPITSVVSIPTAASQSTMIASASATVEDAKSDAASPTFKLLLLAAMVLQNSTTVLVSRYTRTAVPKEELYQVGNLILITEVAKLILSAILEQLTADSASDCDDGQGGGGGGLLHSIQVHIVEHPMDALKSLVPALLYMFQNSLYYVALSNLAAPIFHVTYQSKLVTTALVSVVMLKRKYSPQQWVCIVALSLGVAIVVLDQSSQRAKSIATAADTASLVKGLSAVTMACFSSAMAGVYFEKVVKAGSNRAVETAANDQARPPPVSVWMRNIQLAFFTICTSMARTAWRKYASSTHAAVESTADVGLLYGFTGWVWLLVFLQAVGGMLVAAVIKYADNVMKGLATGVSVCVSTLVSVLVLGEKAGGSSLSTQFAVGAVIILASVYFFSNPIRLSSSAMSGGSSVDGGRKNKKE